MEKSFTSPRAQKATGNTRFEKLHEDGGSVRQQPERQRETRRRSTSRCPPSCEHSSRKGGCVRSWRERSTLAPQCGRHEDWCLGCAQLAGARTKTLARLWWSCRAAQDAHFRERKRPSRPTWKRRTMQYRRILSSWSGQKNSRPNRWPRSWPQEK